MRSDLLDKLPFAPVVGAMFGLVAGILVLATPHWLFERAIGGSFLPGLVSAAEPPLGDKARIMAMILAIALIGAIVWQIVAQAEKLLAAKKPIEPAKPVTRSYSTALLADARPRPIFAGSDLGAPFMSDEAFAFGREELVLDAAMIEQVAQPEPVIAASVVEGVGAMLTRLENAIERRATATGNTAPKPGNMNELRAALGIAA